MDHLALLTPVSLMLLMLLLGHFEHWLDQAAPPPPTPRPERGRWRRAVRPARSPAAADVGAGRRLLPHRARASTRRRPAVVAPRTSAPRTELRRVLRGRLRSGR